MLQYSVGLILFTNSIFLQESDTQWNTWIWACNDIMIMKDWYPRLVQLLVFNHSCIRGKNLIVRGRRWLYSLSSYFEGLINGGHGSYSFYSELIYSDSVTMVVGYWSAISLSHVMWLSTGMYGSKPYIWRIPKTWYIPLLNPPIFVWWFSSGGNTLGHILRPFINFFCTTPGWITCPSPWGRFIHAQAKLPRCHKLIYWGQWKAWVNMGGRRYFRILVCGLLPNHPIFLGNMCIFV